MTSKCHMLKIKPETKIAKGIFKYLSRPVKRSALNAPSSQNPTARLIGSSWRNLIIKRLTPTLRLLKTKKPAG